MIEGCEGLRRKRTGQREKNHEHKSEPKVVAARFHLCGISKETSKPGPEGMVQELQAGVKQIRGAEENRGIRGK